MKKNNPKIKGNIGITDKVNAIEGIVSTYFTDGDYTPYYSQMGEIIAIARYFIEGLEFEKDESIYRSVVLDEEVMELVNEFYNTRTKAGKMMNTIKELVKDKVDFVKEQTIHSHADMDKIIEFCNIVIDSFENFSKLNLTQMSKEDMDAALNVMRQLSEKDFTKDDMADVIKKAANFDLDKAATEIIDAKNAKIRELKKYKTLWEVRNVVADDKVIPFKK